MPLQKEFRGLADLVGLYEGGSLQLELDRGLKGVVDLLPFIEPLRYATANKTIDTLGEFNPIITAGVPANELHLVRIMGIASAAVVPAASTVIEVPRVAINNGSTQFGVTDNLNNRSPTFCAQATNQYINVGVNFSPLLVLNPGDQLGWFTSYITGAAWPITATMAYGYHRVRI